MTHDLSEINRTAETAQAERISCSIVSHIHRAGGGHFGGALSVLDILLVLLRDIVDLRALPGQRNHVVLSKGHAATALYCVLIDLGLMPEQVLDGYGRDPKAPGSHPEVGQPYVDVATGSLGQGLSVALGLATVLQEGGHSAFAVLGDGECQEGQVWEAAMLAERLGLDNLTAIVDCNGFQEYGYREGASAAVPVRDLQRKWEAFGWTAIFIDGHDEKALQAALCGPQTGPRVVLAETRKGRNVPFFLKDPDRAHCTELTESEYQECLS
jgi:transketolase